MRISNSFSEGEVQVLEFIIQTLLRGGSPNMATRHKEFASLCRKVMAMRAKVNEGEKKRAVPTESSVGTIGAANADDVSTDAEATDDSERKAI
ncbi:MAG: hypothetical protein IPK60_03750 [Sandaracinaceae bacterium]|jgi:hypothetical protein|nr:hypothetical protein [Sandaracinaceae bacterium]